MEHGTPSTVQWALTRDGEDVPFSLEDNGGTLALDGVGNYILTATVTDELGKEFTATLPLEVYPMIDLVLRVPETAYAGQPTSIYLTASDYDVTWEVTSETGAIIKNIHF